MLSLLIRQLERIVSVSKIRLDQAVAAQGLVVSRSQAESFIRLGKVEVNGYVITKAGHMVSDSDRIVLKATEQYVSRAGLKLASVAELLELDFRGKTVLDVGSSTGGFTDYALQHGAAKVIAVDVGTEQLHPTLRADKRIELHEKTDIRDFKTTTPIDIIVIDVSFISLAAILPAVYKFSSATTEVIAMAKPQFEAQSQGQKHGGVIKNDAMRRDILKRLEQQLQQQFVILDKRDSEVAGTKGNRERFYKLKKIKD